MLTLYQVLALPSTATRNEIRAAYLHQMARLRTGELPELLEDWIERAYATLDHPDRRIEYDLYLALASEHTDRFAEAVATMRGWIPAAAGNSRRLLAYLRRPLSAPRLPDCRRRSAARRCSPRSASCSSTIRSLSAGRPGRAQPLSAVP
jgi:hypothetical protein